MIVPVEHSKVFDLNILIIIWNQLINILNRMINPIGATKSYPSFPFCGSVGDLLGCFDNRTEAAY